jgi:hypothetical protein
MRRMAYALDTPSSHVRCMHGICMWPLHLRRKRPPALVKKITSPHCHGAVKVIGSDFASPSFSRKLDRVVLEQKYRTQRFYSSSSSFSCSGFASCLFSFFGRRLPSIMHTYSRLLCFAFTISDYSSVPKLSSVPLLPRRSRHGVLGSKLFSPSYSRRLKCLASCASPWQLRCSSSSFRLLDNPAIKRHP